MSSSRQRRSPESIYRRFARLVDRSPGRVLAATLVLTALVASGLSRIKFARSIDENDLPQASEMLRSLRTVSTLFEDDSRRVFVTVSVPREGGRITTPETVRLIADLTAELKRIPFVKARAVTSLTTAKKMRSQGDDLSAEPIVRGSTQGEIERSIGASPDLLGRLISKDLGTALIIAPVAGDAEITRVHEEFTAVLERHRDQAAQVKLGILGDPEILYQLNKNIEKDIKVFVSLSLFLTLLGFFLVFRTWQGVAQPLLVVIASILWTMGCVGFWGEPITLISATLPVVMVIIAGSYAVHVYFHLLEHEKRTGNFVDAVAELFESEASPLFMAMITTFLGGLSLLTFKIRPLQHFGVFEAWGSLISLLLTAVIVPSFHRIAGGRRRAMQELPKEWRTPVERFMTAISRLATRHPGGILAAALALVVLSLVPLSKIRIGFDAVAVFPPDHPVRLTAEHLDRAFGGTRNFEIAVDSGAPEGAAQPAFLDKLRRFESECLKIGIVTRSFSLVRLIDQARQALAPPEMLLKPMTSDEVAQHLMLLGMSESMVPLSSLITPDNRYAKVSVTLNSTRTADFEAAHDRIQGIGRDIFGEGHVLIGGRPMFSVAMTQYLVWGKIQNVFSTILTLILLLLVRYRSVGRSLITSVPLAVAGFATFGLMGLLGLQLDYITATITSFAMGMGSDFAIHLVSSTRKQLKETRDVPKACALAASGPGKVILYNAGCTVLGFSVMVFSRFTALRVFALLICFNMIVILGLTLVIIPAIVERYRPGFFYRYTRFTLNRTEALIGSLVIFGLIAATLATERLF